MYAWTPTTTPSVRKYPSSLTPPGGTTQGRPWPREGLRSKVSLITPLRSLSLLRSSSRTPGLIALRAFFMAVLISCRCFVYGYDVRQTCGSLGIPVFLVTFGGKKPNGDAYFTNSRSALTFGMMRNHFHSVGHQKKNYRNELARNLPQLSIGSLLACLVVAAAAQEFGGKRPITRWCLNHQVGVVTQIAAQGPHWYQAKSPLKGGMLRRLA